MASSAELNPSNTGQDFSASLLVLANYSNFYSVITVLVCFIITVVFILRLNGDHIAFSSSVVVKHVIPEQRMVGIQTPFSLQMDPTKNSSLLSGLHCVVSSLVASRLYSFWGVNIQALYQEFQLPWQQLQEHIHSDNFLTGSYVCKDEPLVLDCCSEKQLHLPTPQAMADVSMAANSRTIYPIVLLNVSRSSTHPTDGSVQVVAMLSAIHLKDSVCSMNSHIINQHLKTYNNQIFNLQPLFIASLPDDEGSQQTTQVPSSTVSAKQSSQSHLTEDVNTSSSNITEMPSSSASGMKDVTASSSEGDLGTTANAELQASSAVCDKPVSTDCNATDSESSTQNDCIVCQCESISMALLPCRHACVCRTCFSKLERCPMCREYIHSYFCLEDPGCYSSNATLSTSSPVPYAAGQMHRPAPHIPMQRRTLKQWLLHVNNVVNEYLGF
ncbi:cell growth regulator with RING finger domain protein 1 [Octopus sinensis]|uniref:Cell growth regulator with RING finger domain protein 1 n=1 Tax=Octopus sinensis TaxID=2607531 RepID=A0A6P7T603_9MOLL|nr:cell growth regulator with RING finger domain protein 1 [Octopus sinensis]